MYSHNDLTKVSWTSLGYEIILKCEGIRAVVGGQSMYN